MSTDIAELAARLTTAVDTRTATTPLTNDVPGLSVEDAYLIQDAVVQARIDAGLPMVAAKLGLTSEAKQRQMNVSEPLYGRLTSDMLVDAGQPLIVDNYIQPRCEPEIAFLLGKDLEGPHVSAAHVLDATSLVLGAIDILDSRFAGYSFKHPDVVADNASCAGFTIGPVGLDPRGLDLRLVSVTLEHNGRRVHTASGAAVMGHPASSVAWMVRALAKRGMGLKAGQLVLSGSLTEAVAVKAGDVVTARYSHLGTIELPCI
jgi:2-oxo-3-hexenedioate decarboxylase